MKLDFKSECSVMYISKPVKIEMVLYRILSGNFIAHPKGERDAIFKIFVIFNKSEELFVKNVSFRNFLRWDLRSTT